MDETTSLIGLIAAVGVLGLVVWRDRRPYVPGKPPIIPFLPVAFVAILVACVCAAHLISLKTGVPLKGAGQ
jgi:hypothetical protein